MSRKKIRIVIVLASLFYVLVAVMALFLLKQDESVLAEQTMSEILFRDKEGEKAGTEAEPRGEGGTASSVKPAPEGGDDPNSIISKWTEAVTEKPTEAPTEKITEPETEAPTEKITETETEAPTEAPTEKVTEAETEAPTEAPTEKVTEAETEAPTEAPTEKVTEAETEAPTEEPAEELPEFGPQEDGKYYIFESINKNQYLLMRESGSRSAKAIGQMKSHTTGVVVELGGEWTKVYAKSTVGYCITEALEIREATREEFEDMIRHASAE